MYGIDWPEPVVVEHKVPNRPIVVWSNEEAVNCLMGNWPTKDGARYHAALQTLMLVLDGRAEPEEARDAFKAAVLEAGFTVH
ncbi:hypothetical protein ABID21_003667 [Pseudorhizobium tarimense]|uniref:DUF982 domain-containing protein n=1 Tax=Pseudorhizobium tarimense TaxID=1079109 RepID=A0ABV2HBG3_9HYPH|nr:DUF982 domain-containing protein [Pseudorhizobium tarimense]MCJ8520470.1 DUF982 domain-containing protein [Pseudorhizobium tarimense]